MKKILILLSILSFQFVCGQAPSKMSYQAVVRGADNNLISNQQVGVKISILEGNIDGNVIYEELHVVTSNLNGLITLVIGNGTPSVGSIDGIDWSNNTFFMKSEIDPTGGTQYEISGVQQILSVPFALHANTASNFDVSAENVGDMLYWNGSDWVSIPAGSNGEFLSFCYGKPTWGFCLRTELISVSSETALIECKIRSNANPDIIEKGVCYGTNPNPTTSDFTQTVNNELSVWSNPIAALEPNTTYYAKTYIKTTVDTQYGNEISFTTNSTLGVGDYYEEEGGIIFYMLQPGDPGYEENTPHGFIVSLTHGNSYASMWGCNGQNIGGTSSNILTGSANTDLIINNCSDTSFAAIICNNYSSEGFNDWFLGSADELSFLLLNRGIVNTTFNQLNNNNLIGTSRLWTSSEVDANNAKTVFNNGSVIEALKTQTNRVRPIRFF